MPGNMGLSMRTSFGFQDLAGQRFNGLEREDHLDRNAEKSGNLEGEFQGRAVVSAFDVPDGLEIDPHGFSQILAGKTPLRPQHVKTIVYHTQTR
jgi:hypothetical protein